MLAVTSRFRGAGFRGLGVWGFRGLGVWGFRGLGFRTPTASGEPHRAKGPPRPHIK